MSDKKLPVSHPDTGEDILAVLDASRAIVELIYPDGNSVPDAENVLSRVQEEVTAYFNM
tara:strand:+ start:413 stop:589 length:177 start_codon:yes stop_codon:yes gene_type:complete